VLQVLVFMDKILEKFHIHFMFLKVNNAQNRGFPSWSYKKIKGTIGEFSKVNVKHEYNIV
jgi:hypothetical protein